MSSLNMPTTPKTPGSVKSSHKGRWYQSMNMDINKSLVTPGSSKSSYYRRSRRAVRGKCISGHASQKQLWDPSCDRSRSN